MPLKKVIETKKLSRIFKNGEIEVRALTDVDMIINEGEFVAIMGASGSGKSTLLHIIGCLDSPTSGEYDLDSVRVNELNKNQLADVRNQKIGFIFQSYNLPHTNFYHHPKSAGRNLNIVFPCMLLYCRMWMFHRISLNQLCQDILDFFLISDSTIYQGEILVSVCSSILSFALE